MKPKARRPLRTRVITCNFFTGSFAESDYEHKRKYKLVESIQDSPNILHNFFDAMEQEDKDFEDLEEVQEDVSNE